MFQDCNQLGSLGGDILWAVALLQEQLCLLGHPAELPRAVPVLLSGLHVDKSRLRALGTGRKTQVIGGFVALLDDFSPDKFISPSVSLGEVGERCGKSLQEHEYLLQLVLQGFWTTCLPFITASHAWDMEKASQKTCSERLSFYKRSCSELLWEEGGIFKQKLWKMALWTMKVIPLPRGRAFHLPFGPFDLFHCWIRATKESDSKWQAWPRCWKRLSLGILSNYIFK